MISKKADRRPSAHHFRLTHDQTGVTCLKLRRKNAAKAKAGAAEHVEH